MIRKIIEGKIEEMVKIYKNKENIHRIALAHPSSKEEGMIQITFVSVKGNKVVPAASSIQVADWKAASSYLKRGGYKYIKSEGVDNTTRRKLDKTPDFSNLLLPSN